jgi:hypothetical protein
VYASSTELFPDCYPVASTLHYRFPERSGKPAVELNWYDGGIKPERLAGMAPDVDMSVGGEGVMYTGERGRLLTGYMAQSPRLFELNGKLARSWPPVTPPDQPFQPSRPGLGPSATAADTAHYMEWIKACHGGPPASTNYEFERPIVESLMLGNVAIRTQELLQWDTKGFRLTRGSERASALLKPVFRRPWSVA